MLTSCPCCIADLARWRPITHGIVASSYFSWRTGKRTVKGMLDDLVNSVIRYFSNNFCDGYFEDCLNVAFNKVQMGPNTDHRAKSLWSNTFVMFFLLAILPALFVIYAVSHFANPSSYKESYICRMFLCYWFFTNPELFAASWIYFWEKRNFLRRFICKSSIALFCGSSDRNCYLWNYQMRKTYSLFFVYTLLVSTR